MADSAKIGTEKPEKKFTWGLFITGGVLFLIGMWFGMSTLHYKASESVFPFRTAGWFVIGFPFFALAACGFSAVFCLIAQKVHKTAWILMLIASSLFLLRTVNSALPYNQLAKITGEELAGKLKLEEFYKGDSFNDGEFAYGIICGNESTMKLITEHKVLEHKISVPIQFTFFKNHKLPETGDIYSDSHGYFYVSHESNKIYFYWHSFIYNAKKN